MKTTWAIFQGDASSIVHYEAYLRKTHIKFSKEIIKIVFFEYNNSTNFYEMLAYTRC